MDSYRLINLALLLSLNTACVSATPSSTSTSSVSDVEYRLPELKFDVKAQYQLRACGLGKGVDGNPKFFAKVKSSAEVSPQLVAGDDVHFFSPSAAAALKKRSDHEFAFSLRDNGTLESFNSTVTDKTGSIIGNVIKFATNVLTLGFGALADAQDAEKDRGPSSIPCVDDIVTHLDEAHKYVKAIETHDSTLKNLLLKTTISEADGKEITRLQSAIASLKSDLTDYRMEHLTIKHTHTIEPANLDTSNLLAVPNEKLKKWFKKLDVGLMDGTIMDLALSSKPAVAPMPVTPDSTSLLIQKPVQSTYRLCRGLCKATFTHKAAEEELARGQVQVPQWGNQQLVDFKVKAFEKRTLNMTFNEAGAVTKLTWSKPSRADQALVALAGAAEGAVGLLEVTQYGRELAETKALKIETDLISQRNALREAQNKQDVLFSTAEVEDPGPETIQVILIAGDGS